MTDKKPLTIATHNGAFHADDVFAVAVLKQLYPTANVVRTRDPKVIDAADFAIDVGGVWKAKAGRFDHHQKGFDGKRANGVVYASSGLVWSAYGEKYIRSLFSDIDGPTLAQAEKRIDEQLVQPLDKVDTGADQCAPGFFGLSALVHAFNPTRFEDRHFRAGAGEDQAAATEYSDRLKLETFKAAVGAVQLLLARVTATIVDEVMAETVVRSGIRVEDGRILLLREAGLAWERVVHEEMPETMFVVYPDSSDKEAHVRVVPVEPGSFTAKRDLPAAWAGLRGADLAKVTGVTDAVFCHNARFIAGAETMDGALRMARIALAD